MKITRSEHLGFKRVTSTYDPGEFEFAEDTMPEEGWDVMEVLRQAVDKFPCSGEEAVYGWIRLLQHLKDEHDGKPPQRFGIA